MGFQARYLLASRRSRIDTNRLRLLIRLLLLLSLRFGIRVVLGLRMLLGTQGRCCQAFCPS
jgi:hypothetical protein